jgi:molybdopterin-guanine dinucleotide biosynthesis protein A
MIEGFILVGGASSRMGTDKARLEVNGRSFVERIAGALACVTERVSVVGAREESAVWQLPVVPDVYAKWGALGGLHAALAACRAPWAAVVACDLPLVTGELFARLAARRENFDAVVPVQPDGRPQPLCALYRVETCLGRAEELIASGERRPRIAPRRPNALGRDCRTCRPRRRATFFHEREHAGRLCSRAKGSDE